MTPIRQFILPLTALLLTSTAAAQELKENINVEGTYTPEIIRQERISSRPSQTVISSPASTLPYETKGQQLEYDPYLIPMQATAWGASRTFLPSDGYLRATLGSYLDSDLSAGYRFLHDGKTSAGAWLQFNSSSLYRNEDDEISLPYRRRYDGRLGLYGSHSFGDVGRLSASLSYGFGYYNYYAAATPEFTSKAPWQATNQADIKLRWEASEDNRLDWSAGAGLHYLGFRDFYRPLFGNAEKTFLRTPGQRETDVNLYAHLRMPWESGSRLGLDAAFDMLFYSGATADGSFHLPEIDDYAALTMTPYYGFQRGLLNVRLGADVDLSFNAGPKGHRYSFLHVAPDVRFDWRKGAVAFYLHLLGGSELQTLSLMRDRNYYTMPALETTRPVFSPIDGKIGLSFGPVSGFRIAATMAFKVSNNIPLAGWYQYWLANPLTPAGQSWAYDPSFALYPEGNNLNIKGWQFGLDLDYRLSSLLEVAAKATYAYQRNGHGYFNGYDRPRYTLDASLKLHPTKALTLSADYLLRARRYFYYRNFPDPAINDGHLSIPTTLNRMKAPNFSQLSFSAEYAVTERFALRVAADNLLCRKNVLIPGVSSGKLAATGGFSLLF
ncbi:MAG: hypothetical protein HDS85_03365 [Bacteroidales bacterium]|nr:hypothetical protein [Bacteroidales bacterium]